MATPVLRTADAWYVADPTLERATRIATGATTTAELLDDRVAIETAAAGEHLVVVADLDLTSPVTTPCRVVAQMTNYRSHVKDSGMDPDTVPLTFFRKASGSISGPTATIRRPAHVTLLDYEVEVGLVIGRPLEVGDVVTPATWTDHVAGLVVTNDVSARDVQLPKTQFYEAKSFPTFTPVGPVLLLLDSAELQRFHDLRLTLTVNGETRQDALVRGDLIYPPAAALDALSRFQRLDTGDLVLTGTPSGTALVAPPKIVEIIAGFLPPARKWRIFFSKQAKNPRYLAHGDVIETRIATDDGQLDLGRQRTVVEHLS